MAAKNTTSRAIALISGGVSTAPLLDYCEDHFAETTPVYIRSGFKWEDSELFWIKKILRHKKRPSVNLLHEIEMPLRDLYQFHWSVTGVKTPKGDSPKKTRTISGRELLMISKAFSLAVLDGNLTVVYGRHISSASSGYEIPVPDLRNLANTYLGESVSFKMPFIELSSEQLIKSQGPDAAYYFSCLNPKGMHHCGECFKCCGRKITLFKAGINDKTDYVRQDSLLQTA